MKLADVDLNLLLVFDALMRERSVTLGARRVGVGQPAMSAALGRLRRLFGDELFVRAAGALQPTPKALRIAPRVAEALERVRGALADEAPFEPATAAQTFTLAGTDYTSQVLLPPLAARLAREAPHVDLRVVGYDKDAVAGMLDRGEADAVVGVFPDPPERCVRTPLFRERFVGVCRAGHPALADGTVGAEAWAALPHALVSVRRDASGALDDALRRLKLRRRVALTLPHMMALPPVLAASDLVSALPSRIAAALAGGVLRTFALPVATAEWEVAMLWNPAARTDAAAAWLRAMVADAAGAA
jgi:DNA-binding transcriptional LysR family regulator